MVSSERPRRAMKTRPGSLIQISSTVGSSRKGCSGPNPQTESRSDRVSAGDVAQRRQRRVDRTVEVVGGDLVDQPVDDLDLGQRVDAALTDQLADLALDDRQPRRHASPTSLLDRISTYNLNRPFDRSKASRPSVMIGTRSPAPVDNSLFRGGAGSRPEECASPAGLLLPSSRWRRLCRVPSLGAISLSAPMTRCGAERSCGGSSSPSTRETRSSTGWPGASNGLPAVLPARLDVSGARSTGIPRI